VPDRPGFCAKYSKVGAHALFLDMDGVKINGLRRASQVALICNVVFLFCVLLRYVTFVRRPEVISITLILGWLMAFWINAFVNGWVVVLLCRRRLAGMPRWLYPEALPRWLLLSNAGIGVVQLYYYFFQ
jgi:hypothetical protein